MMSKNRLILILGLWTALVPFLGLPSSVKNFFTIVSGLIIALTAFLIARQKRISPQNFSKNSRSSDVYVQSTPEKFTDIDYIRKNAEEIKNS